MIELDFSHCHTIGQRGKIIDSASRHSHEGP
jgi:hypothetical protein